MDLITIKDYADRSGISYEAARQLINRHRDELGDHITKRKKTQYLDEEAVELLNGIRGNNELSARMSSDAEELADLRQEKAIMLQKIAEQADRISALAEWKAEQSMLIAEAAQTRAALEVAQTERNDLSSQLSATKDKLDAAEEEIQQLRGRSLWQRIRNL